MDLKSLGIGHRGAEVTEAFLLSVFSVILLVPPKLAAKADLSSIALGEGGWQNFAKFASKSSNPLKPSPGFSNLLKRPLPQGEGVFS